MSDPNKRRHMQFLGPIGAYCFLQIKIKKQKYYFFQKYYFRCTLFLWIFSYYYLADLWHTHNFLCVFQRKNPLCFPHIFNPWINGCLLSQNVSYYTVFYSRVSGMCNFSSLTILRAYFLQNGITNRGVNFSSLTIWQE